MGGGGSYYDRDVTPRREVRSSGYSDRADKVFRKPKAERRCDPAMKPNRRIVCPPCSGALAIALDVTSSMGGLPRILYDKMPVVAGELLRQKYLGVDPQISIAAVGDVNSDIAPIQVADFSSPRELDSWLKRMLLERGGGGTGQESYEFAAYAYAEICDLNAAPQKVFIITGDEDYYDVLEESKLRQHFGGNPLAAFAPTVFDKLKSQFSGNVFHIHRKHRGRKEEKILRRWQNILGESRVIMLPEDMAIADVVLGILALATGGRTLSQYCAEMKNRDQTAERIAEVEKSLSVLGPFKKKAKTGGTTATSDGPPDDKSAKTNPTKNTKNKPYQI